MVSELFFSTLNLISNLNTNDCQALNPILKRTSLVDVMTRAAAHQVLSGKLLASLVFLASVLGYFRKELGLARADQVKLC